MPGARSAIRADRVSAWAVGVGAGLIATMLTWLVANRLTALAWDTPVGPIVALIAAFVAGLLTTCITGVRLDRSVR